MGFTVTRQGGAKDAEFEAYARLLRQRGVDLGKLPRVPEPDTKRRWLYVWNTREEAQTFATELTKRTGDPAWEVIPTTAKPSEGPMGPILIQLARQADGLTFALHPLSRALIRSAFPDAVGESTVSIDTQTWYDFQRTHGDLGDLVRQIAPNLTGLRNDQLATLGYAVIDQNTERTFVFVPPAEVA